VCLVVGDSLLVVDAAVQGDVDAEGQESHAASLSHGEKAPDDALARELGAMGLLSSRRTDDPREPERDRMPA
jgi:hypothetical protein